MLLPALGAFAAVSGCQPGSSSNGGGSNSGGRGSPFGTEPTSSQIGIIVDGAGDVLVNLGGAFAGAGGKAAVAGVVMILAGHALKVVVKLTNHSEKTAEVQLTPAQLQLLQSREDVEVKVTDLNPQDPTVQAMMISADGKSAGSGPLPATPPDKTLYSGKVKLERQ